MTLAISSLSRATLQVVSRKLMLELKLLSLKLPRKHRQCTQTHLPRTTFSHAQSLHRLLVGVYSHVTHHVWLKHMIGVHLCVPHITLHPLRAMSYTLQHSTPCTGTPSSPLPVQRSEQHSHDPRPQQRGTSVELPPPTPISGTSRLLNSVAVHVMHSQKKYADV